MPENQSTGLVRKLGLWGLIATGVCSMLGASINVVPFMIQRNVPGIAQYVLPAFLLAAIPAIFAAFAYAILASAMPKAGGTYVYVSRSLNPYLGFIASFSQWFGLSIVIGVISYIIPTFFRDLAIAVDWINTANALETPVIRVGIALVLLWSFVWVNIRGITAYERTLIPMMIVMFVLGFIVIIAGFIFDHQDFLSAIANQGKQFDIIESAPFDLTIFMAGAALLFSSFIGFDSIAQAGGEAKNPSRNLPLAIGIAILGVGLFYVLVTSAVYHAVPWSFVAAESLTKDVNAPGLLSYLLSPTWTVLIVAGAAIALTNDLPAMLLSVSRLVFAWAEDGIFPKRIARVHSRHHTPHIALIISGIVASIGVLGSHFAGDFFLGIDIMVTSMLVNFLLMSISLYFIHKRNPEIGKLITVLKSKMIQFILAILGILSLTIFLLIHIYKDSIANLSAWYFHSSPIWLIVILIASIIFLVRYKKLKNDGINLSELFKQLPPQ